MPLLSSELWEILVPQADNAGKVFEVAHHKLWDKLISEEFGGVTILPATKGRWFTGETVQAEIMIPVRVCANRKEIVQIMDFTRKYYRQKSVMAYKVSDEVLIES